MAVSHKSPGRTSWEPITLERGITHDTAFEDWVNQVWSLGAGQGGDIDLTSFRKDLVLEFHNEAGQIVLAYRIYRCWPSAYQALPELDANSGAVAIELLTLENEGWERDRDVAEPQEPG